MADSLPRQKLTGTWQAVSALLPSLTTGTALKVQHVTGSPVDIAISSSQPTTDIGERMESGDFFAVSGGENDVWLRATNNGKALVSIQDNS